MTTTRHTDRRRGPATIATAALVWSIAAAPLAADTPLPIPGEEYIIQARHSQLNLAVLDGGQLDGVQVCQMNPVAKGGDDRAQRWVFNHTSSGYAMKSVVSGRYITAMIVDASFILPSGWDDSTYVNQFHGTFTDFETAILTSRWTLEEAEDGYFYIKLQANRAQNYLTMDNASMTERWCARVWPNEQGFYQQWKLIRVSGNTGPVITGVPVLKWQKFCQSTCNIELTEEVTKVNGRESTITDETRTAITNAISAGVEYSGVTMGAEHSQTDESARARSMAESFSTSMTETRKETIAYDTSTNDIFSVWQWVAVNQMSDGSEITVNSRQYTCRPDGVAPTYLPGSPEDIASCHVPRRLAPKPD